MRSRNYFIYILTNFTNTTLYIGVTNNPERRLWQHRHGLAAEFSKKYKLTKMVYIEEFSDPAQAIAREKQLKNWHRQWKINLIKSVNPDFKDLSLEDPETSSG